MCTGANTLTVGGRQRPQDGDQPGRASRAGAPGHNPSQGAGASLRWRRMLEAGHYATVKDLATAQGINPSYASQVLRLTLLSSDIIKAILDGRQPVGLRLGGARRSVHCSGLRVCLSWLKLMPGAEFVMRTFCSADAKNHFVELVDSARIAPVAVTDKPFLVVMAVKELERLKALETHRRSIRQIGTTDDRRASRNRFRETFQDSRGCRAIR